MFMKFAIVGRNNNKWIVKLLKKHKFKIVKKNPNFVICNGGDGTILYGERVYPGIPKLAIKTSKVCRKCDYAPKHLDYLLQRIKQGKYRITEMTKIKASFKGKELVALNEIQVRHKMPTKAIRISLFVNGKAYRDVIGDGVIVATPFGSTAYYKSAGGKAFKKGIGIVFNNVYSDGERSFVVTDKAKIRVKVEREHALLIADNYEKFVELKPRDEVKIGLARSKCRFLQF